MSTDREIAEERNKVNKEIALWQTLGNVVPKLVPVALGAKVVKDSGKNNNNSGNSSNSNPIASVGVEMSSKEQAHRRADDLFPNLEPTFEIKPLDSKVTKFGINTAMAGALVALMSSMPILGL